MSSIKIKILKKFVNDLSKSQTQLKKLRNHIITGSMRSRVNHEIQMNSIRLSWLHGEIDTVLGKTPKNLSTSKGISGGTIEDSIKHNKEITTFLKTIKETF